MNDNVDLTHADFARIEAEARRLRAEAAREMFTALTRAVAGLFTRKGASRAA